MCLNRAVDRIYKTMKHSKYVDEMTADISQTGIATFVVKLWKMLNNPKTSEIMTWSQSGTTFIIKDQISFISNLLPMYFKHNNMGSFIRQLNLYDFHKICVDKELEYQHKFFQRARPELMKHIKRKLPKFKRTSYTKADNEEFSEVTKDIDEVRNQQESMRKTLELLQKENLTLLKQLSNLHVKHNRQTTIIRKIIEVLIPFMDSFNTSKERADPKIFEVDPKLAEKLEAVYQLQASERMYLLDHKEDFPSTDSIQVYQSPSSTPNSSNLQLASNVLLDADTELDSNYSNFMEEEEDEESLDDSIGKPMDIKDALGYLDNNLTDLLVDDTNIDMSLFQNSDVEQAVIDAKREMEMDI